MNFQTVPKKPKFGESCNGCGYCCAIQPCELAREFLRCTTGPCVALESQSDKAVCGLVRNPLGYLYKAAHPHSGDPSLDTPHAGLAAKELSDKFAVALGIGLGCDAEDSEESAAWPAGFSTRYSEQSI